MIVLAHCGPPWYLFQARNFDVPLMVLISGITYAAFHRREAYLEYIWKRVKRLIFPVWIFLTALFSACALLDFPRPLPDMGTIASSYFLMSGIGYVWIIRVFILVALVAPTIIFINTKIKSNFAYLTSLLTLYVLYELAVYLTGTTGTSALDFFRNEIIFYMVPYAVIFALGVRIQALSVLSLISIAILLFIYFSIHAGYLYINTGDFIQTQTDKYPPTAYYLSYAVGVSTMLWLLAPIFTWIADRTKMKELVSFISRNSIWFYLWHIIFVMTVSLPFYLKFPLVFVSSGLITWAHVSLVENHLIHRIKNPALKRNALKVLTG